MARKCYFNAIPVINSSHVFVASPEGANNGPEEQLEFNINLLSLVCQDEILTEAQGQSILHSV